MVQALDIHGFPLQGCRLIEASAGTGKTWTIASLYLRLILGHGTPRALVPSQILVMTFTRAATQELSDRIRARLLQAARWFRDVNPSASTDTLLQQLRADYPDPSAREGAAWQLEQAAEAMDDAAIMTIDAWCQRMLNEHAFETGNPFDETLLAHDDPLLNEAIRDYWRQQCYPLEDEALKRVSACWRDAQAMALSVKPLLRHTLDWPPAREALASVVNQFINDERAALDRLSRGWVDRVHTLSEWYSAEVDTGSKLWDRRQLNPKHVRNWLTQVAAWAARPVSPTLGLSDAARQRLSPEGIRSAYKGNVADLKLPDAFEALQELTDSLRSLPDITERLRRHAVASVSARLSELKQLSRSFSFMDMTRRLETALSGARGAALRRRIINQYPVALIDEFQDTSPEQYRLFDALYQSADPDPNTALVLIGDPKQSIYGFRRADIYTYLKARAACADRIYALSVNHRSTHEMVAAVNAWFSKAEARSTAVETPRLPGGAFRLRHGQANPMPFNAVVARGRDSRFKALAGRVPAMTVQYDLTLNTASRSMVSFAGRCAEQIVSWLNDPSAGFHHDAGSFDRLRPADIAVLVRTRFEAAAVRRALNARGLACVFQSDQDSIFASHEAPDLLRWLRAIAMPTDIPLARAALATRTLALSIPELTALAQQDDVFDVAAERLRDLQSVWQQRGVLAMLRRALHLFDCPARWLASADGERRLTNVLHLAELLQEASAQVEGEQSLIHWLAGRIDESANSLSDDQVVRLESDADLIQIITIHKSKGLEYPVVCLPFACSFKPAERQRSTFVSLPDEQGERILKLSFTDDELAQADLERQREDLRLFYVALTRARHAIWMGFAALKHGRRKDCATHLSAPGYLLAGDAALDEAQWLEPLTTLALSVAPTIISLQPAPERVSLTRFSREVNQPPLKNIKPYQAEFERRWTVGSYSSITRLPLSRTATPIDTRSPAEDERTIADDSALISTGADLGAAPWHRFPGGARAGDFVHGVLEWLAAESFEIAAKTWLHKALKERCHRAGYAGHEESLVQWMQTLLDARLPQLGARLSDAQSIVTEMEFWMPANAVKADAVDRLCRQYLLNGCDRPALPARTLSGMLMGFTDLVFEFEGRYWVLDYKTNRPRPDAALEATRTRERYAYPALQSEMARHRYDVQAAIYLLALHRQLRVRLGSRYDPAQHLGGAIYWFIRGLDDPAQGEYAIPAGSSILRLLDTLDHLIGQPETVT